MTKDKWLNILDTIEAKFGISEERKEPISENIPGEKHIVEFTGPMGKMKLEWTEKPRVKDEKTVYSNRVGSNVKVYKVYDDEDKVNYLNVYKWDEASEAWEEINANLFDN